MEFLLYLSLQSMDVYKMVSKKVKVVENSEICRKHEIFGFFTSHQKTLSICTNTIKSYSNFRENLNETLMHEAVHVAQSCKANFKYLSEFGINSNKMLLSESKKNDLKKVLIFDHRLKKVDHEAFWLEDKPNEVKYVLQKYCF